MIERSDAKAVHGLAAESGEGDAVFPKRVLPLFFDHFDSLFHKDRRELLRFFRRSFKGRIRGLAEYQPHTFAVRLFQVHIDESWDALSVDRTDANPNGRW